MSQDYLDKLIEKDKAGTQIQSIPLHDTELRGITIDDPITVEGNPINFSTKNEQNAIQTVIDLDPIQDLHGYDKPWVGGAGKNLLNYNDSTSGYSTNAVSNMSINNYVITYTATSSDSYFGDFNKNTGLFAISKCTAGDILKIVISDERFSKNYVTFLDDNNTVVSASKVNLDNFTVPNGATKMGFRFGYVNSVSGTTYSFTVMVVISTETDSTFAPYTNICPISPKEQITVQGCGKNLIPYQELGRINQTSGEEETDNSIMRSGFISIEPNTTYFFSGLHSGPLRFFVYDLNKRYIGTRLINTADESFTTNANEYYLRFQAGISVCPVNTQLQIEKGSTATSYEPYTPSNNLQIPLPNDFYGGTLNLETGELVVDRAYVEFDGSSDENWSQGYYYAGSRFLINPNPAVDESAYNNVISNYLFTVDTDLQTVGCIRVVNNNRLDTYWDSSLVSDITEFRTYLSSNPLQVVYELSTPYTLHLTPSQLKLFKDVNNLNSSDYTTLTVTYHSNSIATLAPATDTTDGLLTAIDKRALDRTEEIVEGNPIAFETESIQVAKSTIVNLEPIQDLHGYSKPWVGGAGKNLLPMTLSNLKVINTDGVWNGNAYTFNGITFTVNVDSDNNVISVSTSTGTPSANAVFELFTSNGNFLPNGSYIMNGCPTGGGDNKYKLMIADISTGIVPAADFGGGSNVFNSSDITGSSIRCRIVLYSVMTQTAKTFYPMIRKSTESADFEPYTNITSISGRSEVGILGLGRNQCNVLCSDFSHGGITFTNNGNGTFELHGTSSTAVDFRINQPTRTGKDYLKTYFVNNVYTCQTYTDKFKVRIMQDQTWASVFDTGYSANPVTQIISETKDNCFILVTIPTGKTFNHETFKIMLELGSDASNWEKSQDITISLGQTVYGGQLDVENGVLVVDKASVDLGDLDWVDLGTAVSGAARFKTTLTNKPVRSDLTNGSTSYCSHYDLLTDGATYTANKDGYTISTTDIVFFVDAYKASSTSAFKTAMSGVQVVYTLQDEYKTTISLTPEQVKLLQGVNTITTNADNITLTYRNGSVATLNDLESLYAKLKAYIDSLHSS